MNARCQYHLKYFLSQIDFLACKKRAFLLKANTGIARLPFRGGEVFAFTSLFERWFLSTDSQAGDLLLRWMRGLCGASHCGIEVAEPLDTGFDKIMEMRELEKLAKKMDLFRSFPPFNTLLRGFLRENPGAKTNKNNPQIIIESNLSI